MLKKISGSTEEWVVGNPVVFDEVKRAIADAARIGSTEKIATPTPADAARIVVQKESFGGDVNGDGYYDVVEGQVFRIGYGTDENPYKWITFASVYLGSAENTFRGEKGRTTFLPLLKANATGSSELTAAPGENFWENSAKTYVGLDSKTLDEQVARSVENIFAFCHNSMGYFELLETTQTDRAEEAAGFRKALAANLREGFQFALSAVVRHAEAEGDSYYARRLKGTIRELRQGRFLSREQRDELERKLTAARKRREESGGLKKGLKCDENPDELCRSFSPVPASQFLPFTAAYKQEDRAKYLSGQTFKLKYESGEGGIFQDGETGFISTANRFARAAGFENYAELMTRELHGLSPGNIQFQAGLTMSTRVPKLKRIMEGLRRHLRETNPAGGEPKIWEHNVFQLLRDKIERRFGGSEPKISVDDAINAVKRFFKDIGFDLDNLHLGGEVVLDVRHREGKHAEYEVPIADGRSAVVVMDFGEGDKLTLWQLAKFVHEVSHAVHFHYASRFAGGSSMGGAKMSSVAWWEVLASAFERLVSTGEWVERYLGSYRGFDRAEPRAVLIEEYDDYNTWWDSVVAARAIWEINLYEDCEIGAGGRRRYRPMKERMDHWGELGSDFGFDDIGLPASVVSVFNLTFDHLYSDPLYYGAYAVGRSLGDRLVVTPLREALGQKDTEDMCVGRMQAAFQKALYPMEEGSGIFSILDAAEQL